MKKKCALILMIILAGLAVLTACNDPVEIESISISEKAEDFKTDYIVGEELDLTGILLTVTRTDGSSYDVYAEDIRQDLRILNFSTSRPAEKLTVILEYKEVRTSFDIVVRTDEEGALRYTVTFDSMGGSAVEPQSVPAYSMAVEPAAPVLEGYAFKGWYTETTYNNIFNFSTTNITSEITLYARWAELHTVSFYELKEGVDPETADPDVNPDDYVLLQYSEVPDGDSLSAAPAVPTKEGFNGVWDRTVFSSIAGDLKVYPVYSAIYYTVTFVAEGEEGENLLGTLVNVRKGTVLQDEDGNLHPDFAEQINEFIRLAKELSIPGQEFSGDWYPGLSDPIESNLTLVANFGAVYLTVSLMMNDGTDKAFAEIPVQYNLTLSQNDIPDEPPRRDGYAFDGWYSDKDCTSPWNFTTSITSERKIYAGWRELLEVSFYIPVNAGLEYVTPPEYDDDMGFEAGGVEYRLYTTVLVPSGGRVEASAAAVPQAVGHTGKWVYRDSGQTFNGAESLGIDVDIRASYEAIDYLVRFISDNVAVYSVEVPYGGFVDPPADPSLAGHSFVYWTMSGEEVTDFSTLKITSNVDFTAAFEANTYRVEFYYYTSSQAADSSVAVQYGYSFTFPEAQNTSSRLTGWYASADYATSSQWEAGVPLTDANIESRTGKTIDFDDIGEGSTVLTLYAGWVRQYTLVFQDEKGAALGSSRTLDQGTAVTEDMAPEVAEREGFELNWVIIENGQTGGEFKFGTEISTDLTLRAQFVPLDYEVSFEIEFRYSDNTVKSSYVFTERTTLIAHGSIIGEANIPTADDLSAAEEKAIAAGTGHTVLPEDFGFEWTSGDYNTISNTKIDAADVRFVAYCYVRTFTVNWYSTESGELTEDAVIYSAEVEFGRRAPEFGGETPVKPGSTFNGFFVYTPEGEIPGSTTNVTKDLALRPSFTPIQYKIAFIGPGNVIYRQYDFNNQEKPLNADNEASYSYGDIIRLTEGIANLPSSVRYSDIAVTGYDITGWNVTDGNNLYFDADAGKWYLPASAPAGEDTDSYILISMGGNYYKVSAAAGIYAAVQGWSPDKTDNELFTDFDADGEYRYYFDAVFVYVTEDVDFTLQRKVTEYDVTLHYSETQTETYVISHNSQVPEPANVVAEGKVFIGWYTDESYSVRYDFCLPVTSSFDLWARWDEYVEGSAGITYEVDEENGLSAIAIGYDESLLDTEEITASQGKLQIANYYLPEDGGAGVPVTRIGTGAFANLPDMVTEIVIPDSVTAFGDNAFEGSGLVRIVLPEALTSIPVNCFKNADKLETVVFRSAGSLTSIGNYAFFGCVSLKLDVLYTASDYEGENIISDGGLSLPEGLSVIGKGAFLNDSSVTVVRFPSTVTVIGADAFMGTELKFVVTSSDYIELGANAFENTADWHEAFRVFVPDVGTYGGMGWEQLAGKIYRKDDISNDWAYVLQENSNLVTAVQYLGNDSEVTVPETLAGRNVGAIGDHAFGKGVTKVTFSADIKLSDLTFAAATEIAEIVVKRDDGDYYADNGAALTNAFQRGLYDLKTLSFINPDQSVVSILGGRTLPNSVQTVKIEISGTYWAEVPESFLSGAANVTEVIISGANVLSIGDRAFYGMTRLKKVSFNGTTALTGIGVSAFEGDKALNDVYSNGSPGLPDSLTEIGENAFGSVPWIASFSEGGFTIVGNGILYAYSGNSEIVRIPKEITSVSPGAFGGRNGIKTILIPVASGVTLEIGIGAFEEMPALEAVYIDGSADIASGAFTDSSKFVALVVNGTLNIESGALDGTLYGDGAYEPGSGDKSPLSIYTVGDISTEDSKYSSLNVSGRSIGIGEDGWLYLEDVNSNYTAIKYIGNGDSYAYNERITLSDTYRYVAGYAFPRGAADVEIYTSLQPSNSFSPFGGLTETTTLTLMVNVSGNDGTGSVRSGTGADNLLYALVNASKAGGVQVRINAAPAGYGISLKTVFGLDENAALSSKINSLEIIVSDASEEISDDFVYGLGGIDVITVTNGAETLPLKSAESLLEGISIGQRAFRDTGWMATQSDLVMIGGTLIDAKSLSPVIKLGSNVTAIAGYAFAERPIETLVIEKGEGTIKLDPYALFGAENIMRVYVSSGTVTVGGNGNLTLSGGRRLTLFDDATWGGVQAINETVPVTDVRLMEIAGDSGVVQYIVSQSGKLYMYREFTEEDGVYIGDSTDIVIPEKLEYVIDSGSPVIHTKYAVTSFGSNILYSETVKVGIPYGAYGAAASAFGNLGSLSELEIVISGDGTGGSVSGQEIRNIISAHSVSRLVYNGSVTLQELLGSNESDSGISGRITEIEITYGTVETTDNLLSGWDSISSVIFPDTIRKVGVNSLENTVYYRSILSNHVILGGVLYYRYIPPTGTGQTEITIPKQVLVVNTDAFADLGLPVRTINFESGSVAEQILDGAFRNCTELTNVRLPASLTKVSESAFEFTGIVAENGLLTTGYYDGGRVIIKYTGTATELVMDQDIKVIAAEAFAGNTNLESITFMGDSAIISIGESAFEGCTKLSEISGIVSSSSIRYVGTNAFEGTAWLNSQPEGAVYIGVEGVDRVLYRYGGESEFIVYSDLYSITESEIEKMAGSVTALVFQNNSRVIGEQMLNRLASLPGVYKVSVTGEEKLSDVLGGIHANITDVDLTTENAIVAEALAGWSSVYNVFIYNATAIGENAFAGTAWLGSLSHDANGIIFSGKYILDVENVDVTEISYTDDPGYEYVAADAFGGADWLITIDFSSLQSLKRLPENVFSGCENLEYVILPSGIEVLTAMFSPDVQITLELTGAPDALEITEAAVTGVQYIKVPEINLEAYRSKFKDIAALFI